MKQYMRKIILTVGALLCCLMSFNYYMDECGIFRGNYDMLKNSIPERFAKYGICWGIRINMMRFVLAHRVLAYWISPTFGMD